MFWLKNSFHSHLGPYIIWGIRERERERERELLKMREARESN
jgi:hypothetical protein